LAPIARFGDQGRLYLLYLFLIVFGGDTTAYFIGVAWGRRRLAKQLSPKKSIEGAIGAVAAALILTSLWLRYAVQIPLSSSEALYWLAFAPVLSILAQISDLFESLLKRSQAQKDSGSFIPGHGGILDRIDGLALSCPAFYFFLITVGHGK
jgi:phosphatidate cytidylyltransferase